MAKTPTPPIVDPGPDRPNRPDQGLPDLGTPERPQQPKGRASARDASTPTTGATSLLPPSAAIGDPSFMLRVVGYGFDASSVIVFAGNDEPTNHVSDTELTTGVNMDVWLGVDPAIPVSVRTTLADGTEETTNELLFAFTEPREVPLPEAHASQPIPSMNLITPV